MFSHPLISSNFYEEQLRLYEQGSHPEQLNMSRKMDVWLKDQMLRLEALHETMIAEAHNEYSKEIEACDKDLESERKRVQEILFSICEDLKARMEEDKRNIELTTSGDVLEAKPQSTRKLRRRGQYGNNIATNNSSSTLLSEVIFNSSRWHGKALLSPRSQQLHSGDETEPTELSVEQCHSFYAEQDKCGSNIFGSLSLNLTDETLLPTLVVSLKNQGSITMATILNDAATQDNCAWVCRYPFLSLAANSSSSNGSGLNGFSGSAGPSLAGISNKKRRLNPNSSQAQLNLQLNENDIYADLNLIHRAGGKGGNSAMNTRKQYQTHQMQQQSQGSECSPDSLFPFRGQSSDPFVKSPLYHDSADLKPEPNTPSSVWIDDGRLYYKQKCFQQGFPVVLEGRDGSTHGCMGTIHLIGAQEIVIRRSSDHGITKVTVHQLKSDRLKLLLDDNC